MKKLLFIFCSFCINSSLQCVATQSSTTTANPCTTCTASLITLTTGNDGDTPSSYSTSTNADGCETITYTCQGTPVNTDDPVLFTFYSNSADPRDVGTASGTGTISQTFTCVDGHWELDGVEINEVECQVIT